MGIDADRRHAHAGPHDRHLAAPPGARETQHVAHGIDLPDIGQVALGQRPRAQGVARHENEFGEIPGRRVDVGCAAHLL